MQTSNQAKNLLEKRWLITGGRGFLGTNLRVALKKDYPKSKVSVVDDFTYNTGWQDDLAEVRHYGVDITNYEAMHDVFSEAKPDYLIHLAASTEVRKSVQRPMQCFDTNANGTLNCLNLARDYGIKRIVVASSCGIVGNGVLPMDESSELDPVSPYASSKACAEMMARAYMLLGVPVVILRFTNIYGPWSDHKSSVIAQFIRNHINGEPFTIYGDGSQSRNFLYVKDAVRAIFHVIRKRASGTFCIGALKSYTINDLVDIFEEKFDGKVERREKKRNKEEIDTIEVNTSKARNFLRFYCNYSLLDGIGETYNWYKEKEYAT